MTDPDHIEQLKDRLRTIKQNPQQALFSEFKGTSRSGGVTVWVDMLGRQKRIHVAPGTVRDGDEQWLTEEINSAYEAASRAATFLDFNLAEFARELQGMAGLAPQQGEPTPKQPPGRRPPSDDDEWFDDFRLGR